MAETGRVHPNCVNAANPYHECGMACLDKIAQGQGQKEKKKFDAVLREKKNKERNGLPYCSKAANPFHECDENCFKTNGEDNSLRNKKESGSWSFGRKKKAPESQPTSPFIMSPRVRNSPPAARNNQGARSPKPEFFPKEKTEKEIDESYTSSEHFSGEIYPSEKDLKQTTIWLPASGHLVKAADKPKDPKKDNLPALFGEILAQPEKETETDNTDDEDAKYQDVEDGNAKYQDVEQDDANDQDVLKSNASQVAYMKFSFSSVDHPPEDSEDEEVESVISDSCVPVGKYHVKARISSTLQSIINRYGDIAANCKLESVSMRAYYLECLCSVVEELKSIPLIQMTKSKVKEMLAVLKDVESAQIDVHWLRNILNEVSDSIEIVNQHQTFETAKVYCDSLLESAKKRLETEMRELVIKEKELADVKVRVAEAEARVRELESEASDLSRSIESMKVKVDNLKRKSLADEL